LGRGRSPHPCTMKHNPKRQRGKEPKEKSEEKGNVGEEVPGRARKWSSKKTGEKKF